MPTASIFEFSVGHDCETVPIPSIEATGQVLPPTCFQTKVRARDNY